MKLKIMVLSGLIAVATNVFANITVLDVQVFSGYPWTEVVVGYTIMGTDADADTVRLTATDKSANKTYKAWALTGAELTEGRHVLRWNAAAEGVKFSSENVVFSVSIVRLGGVQLWENGPYWAECNVGASKPEECGYYFWWGDTVGYKQEGDSWNAVDGSRTGFSFDDGNCSTYGKSNPELQSMGYIDSAGNLVPAHDAATAHLGAPWRMPTEAEFSALISNCTTTWSTRNGMNGMLVTGKGAYASRSIFLPAAGDVTGSRPGSLGSIGYYWSSTTESDSSRAARYRYFYSGGFDRYGGGRSYGQSVRPIRGFAQ